MLILAIDPGKTCGWALLEDGRRIESGVWKLEPKRHESRGMAFLRLRARLREVLGAWPIDAVAYEEVASHKGTAAAHWYGGIVAHVQAECLSAEPSVPYTGIPVATIKRRATGKGNAGKPAMLAAARERWPEVETHDEADALWCGVCLAEDVGAAA